MTVINPDDAPARSAMTDRPIDLALARKVLQTEAAAILGLVSRVDDRFEHVAGVQAQARERLGGGDAPPRISVVETTDDLRHIERTRVLDPSVQITHDHTIHI